MQSAEPTIRACRQVIRSEVVSRALPKELRRPIGSEAARAPSSRGCDGQYSRSCSDIEHHVLQMRWRLPGLPTPSAYTGVPRYRTLIPDCGPGGPDRQAWDPHTTAAPGITVDLLGDRPAIFGVLDPIDVIFMLPRRADGPKNEPAGSPALIGFKTGDQ